MPAINFNGCDCDWLKQNGCVTPCRNCDEERFVNETQILYTHEIWNDTALLEEPQMNRTETARQPRIVD